MCSFVARHFYIASAKKNENDQDAEPEDKPVENEENDEPEDEV